MKRCNNSCCLQWFKDTSLKANHNSFLASPPLLLVVSNGSKILVWKQITTNLMSLNDTSSCLQWFKDTSLKANHNWVPLPRRHTPVVSNGSKILVWKQITTASRYIPLAIGCLQWFKDTSLKANHNQKQWFLRISIVVSNGSKILVWKQITTGAPRLAQELTLSPMVQRY